MKSTGREGTDMYGTSDLPATMRPGPVHVCGRPDCGMHTAPTETPAAT